MSEARSAREENAPRATADGIRDNVLVLPSVLCSHLVAEEVADAVEGCVATPHDHGCAQIGGDNERTRNTLLAMGAHPNVAGCVVVGLGCEHVQSDALARDLEARGAAVRELSIQGVGGTDACRERGIEYANELRESERVSAAGTDVSELTVGVVGTDLSDPTVETADPVVGGFVDDVIAAGGRVVLAGRERATAHPEAAAERIDDDLADVLEVERAGPARAPRVRSAAGARSFDDATRSWGSNRVDELVAYGDAPAPDSRLALVDAASRFEEAATALVAAGAHLIVHVTGDGIPTGHPVAPVVKVSATPSTLAAVGADIDVDARTATAEDLLEYVEDVAGGRPAKAETHGVTSFAIERTGPSL